MVQILQQLTLSLILILTLTITLVTSDDPDHDVQVEELTFSNSVLTKTKHWICIPREYRFARMRINYGSIFRNLHNEINVIEKTMGRFGSRVEPYLYAYKRICRQADKNHEGICPLTTVISLTGSLATLRHGVLTKTRILDANLAYLMSVWNHLPTKYGSLTGYATTIDPETVAEWPTLIIDSRTEGFQQITNVPNTVFPTFTKEVNDELNVLLENLTLTEEDTELETPAGTELTSATAPGALVLQELLGKLNTRLELVTSAIGRLNEAGKQMDQGFFPQTLFPLDTWLPRLFPTSSSLSTVQLNQLNTMAQFITSYPLTNTRRGMQCSPLTGLNTITNHCYIDIITFIPFVPTIRRLAEIKLESVPIQQNNKWLRIRVPEGYLFRDAQNAKETKYYFNREELNCIRNMLHLDCALCSSQVSLNEVTPEGMPCIHAITRQKVNNKICAFDVMSHPPADALQITKDTSTEREMVAVNNNPSSLLTTCPTEINNTESETTQSIVNVPTSALIKYKPHCNIRFLDGPEVLSMAPNQAINVIQSTTPKETKEPIVAVVQFGNHTEGRIRLHFHNYGYIYILTTGSGIVLILTISTLTVCCSIWCKKRRYFNTIRRYPHVAPPRERRDENREVTIRMTPDSVGRNTPAWLLRPITN